MTAVLKKCELKLKTNVTSDAIKIQTKELSCFIKCDLHEIYEHLDTYILTSLEVSAQLERVLMTLLSLCSETRTKYFHSYLQQRRQSQE